MYESEDIENVGIKSMEQLTEQPFLLGILITYAEQRGVSPALVLAIIEAESGGDSYAARYEPLHMTKLLATRPQHVSLDTEVVFQKTAWGLMGIFGATARILGFKYQLPELSSVLINLEWGVEYLADLAKQYQAKFGDEGVIAAYHKGAPRRSGDRYAEQDYVDRITAAAAKYAQLVEAKRDEALKAVAENTITPEEAEVLDKAKNGTDETRNIDEWTKIRIDVVSKNTLEQLKELAAARNITADKGWKKVDYAAAIVAAEAKSA